MEKKQLTVKIDIPKTNTADNWKEFAIAKAESLNLHWTDKVIRKEIESHWKDLTAQNHARTDEVKKYIRKDSVGRAWLSRKKQFGESGYKQGKHPKAGTGKPRKVYTDEEKAARKSEAVKRSWESRKKEYGKSGYKAGHSPLNNKTDEKKSA